MLPVFAFIAYLLLALAIPTVWMALSVRRRTAGELSVVCPRAGSQALVKLDTCYAVRMHALGNPELLVTDCSRWPGLAGCGQECREELSNRG